MKKLLIITVCIVGTFLFTFKVVPNSFPGVETLNDYSNTQLTDIYQVDFDDRITAISNVLELSNANGIEYIIKSSDQLNNNIENVTSEEEETITDEEVIDNSDETEEDVSDEEVVNEENTNEELNEDIEEDNSLEYSDINELQDLNLFDITIIDIEENIVDGNTEKHFIFAVEDKNYRMHEQSLIGNTDIFVEEINVEENKVTLKQGQQSLTLEVN